MAARNGDIKIKCCDCSTSFVIKADEQEWYLSRGWEIPRRCKRCRDLKRKRFSNEVELADIHDTMRRGGDIPYRTGSSSRHEVTVSGGVVSEISDFTLECVYKDYLKAMPINCEDVFDDFDDLDDYI